LTTVALLMAALVLGTAVSIWQAVRATGAKNAEMEARVAVSAAKQLAEDRANKIGRDLEQLNAANALIEGGRFHVQYSEWAKAELDFSAAVACRPDNSRVWTERAEFYLRMGLWDLAAVDLAKAFELHPPRSPYAWNHHALLRLYVGDISGYRRICRQMAEQFAESANPQDCAAVARTCLLVDDPAVERAKLVQLAELGVAEQKTAWRLTNLGTALYRAGQYDKAVERLRESQTADANWGKTLNLSILAMAHHRLDQPELARQSLDAAALALDERVRTVYQKPPGFLPTVWWDIVQADLHYREAKRLIDGKPAPDDPRLWVIRGRALVALGRQEEAAGSFGKAIELKFAPAWFSRGYTYQKLGYWDKAKADYEMAGTLAPKNAAVHNSLAWLLATCPDTKFHEPQRAVTLAQKAVDIKPTVGVYWNTLGVARYRAEDLPGAINALLKSIELSQGGDASDGFFLAMAQWRLDQKPNARRWFTHAAQWMDKQKPADEELQRFRAEAADLLGLPEKHVEAPAPASAGNAALYTLVLETDPKAIWTYERRGTALAEAKQWALAAPDLARAVKAKPDDAFLWFCHAMATLGADDLDGYRRVGAGMREQFGKTKDPATTLRLLFVFLPIAEEGADTAELVRWGQVALQNPRERRLLGNALYRDGQYEAAVRHFQEVAKTEALWIDAQLYLAMAQHKAGKHDEARAAFAKAVKSIENSDRVVAIGGYWTWYDQVNVRHLHKEAEALINAN
jgi:Flp pilus assembly protein TadD